VAGNGGTSLTLDDEATHNSSQAVVINKVRYTRTTTNLVAFVLDDRQVTRSNTTVVVLTDARGNVADRRVTGVGPQPFHYTGVGQLVVQGGSAGNRFDVTATASATDTTVLTGVAGAVVNLGDANNTLDPIRGALTVTGQGGNTTLTLNDQGATGPEEYDVYSTRITREPITSPPTSPTQTIVYSGLATVTVNGGNDSGGNIFFALGTPAGTAVSLNAGIGGFNSFFAFDEFSPTDAPPATDHLLGALAFHAHQTSDFGERTDSFAAAGHTFTLSAAGAVSTIRRDGAADLAYDGLSEMVVAVSPVGGNRVNVQSVAPGVFMNITLANGDQAVVGSQAPDLGGSTAYVLGPVAFTDEVAGATSTVTVDDSGEAVRRTQPPVGTGAAQRITIAPPLPSNPNNPDSGAFGLLGDPNQGVFWDLYPGSTVALDAGFGDKTFALLGVVPDVTLSIDGGAGSNTLDYSAFAGNVTVNLPLGTATGVTGGIRNIQNVIGGQGNNLLFGDGNANVLNGGARRNLVIGGGGADQLTGGPGDNILIAGTVPFATGAASTAALDALMQEWTRTDPAADFPTRVADLMAGVGPNGQLALNSQTVRGDPAAARLMGGGHNWFFYTAGVDALTNQQAGDEFTAI
jgi:hypothetical protein